MTQGIKMYKYLTEIFPLGKVFPFRSVPLSGWKHVCTQLQYDKPLSILRLYATVGDRNLLVIIMQLSHVLVNGSVHSDPSQMIKNAHEGIGGSDYVVIIA